MKLLVDISDCSNLQWGTSVYSLRLIDGFIALGYSGVSLLIAKDQEDFIRSRYIGLDYTSYNRKATGVLGLFANEYRRYLAVKRFNSDVVFQTTLSIYHLYDKRVCYVQTIHDLQAIKISPAFKKFVYKCLISRCLNKASLIVSISNFVKSDIESFYPIVARKIVTVYNSVIVPQNIKKEFNYSPYILYVNSLFEYKNAMTLVKAFNSLKENISHNLIIVGKETEYWIKTIKPYIIKNGLISRVILKQRIPNEELYSLYYNADLFVTTSLHEGFGYTPIEAALCKTKVLCTRETALPETTMNLLYYYEPATDSHALSKKIDEVLKIEDKDTLDKIAAKFSEQYYYMKCAKEVYENIANTYHDFKI